MDIEEATQLSMKTDYAVFADEAEGENPINAADAGAFFLEGYEYAKKQEVEQIAILCAHLRAAKVIIQNITNIIRKYLGDETVMSNCDVFIEKVNHALEKSGCTTSE